MIRKMIISDIVKVTQIESKVLGNTLGIDFLYDELNVNPFAHYFVYLINNEIIGYIGFRIYDDSAEMMNFVINTNHQNQGYGQELFDYCLEYITNLNVKNISLEVRKSNTKAKRFYTKNGFLKAYTRKNYYENEDALVLMKEV